MWPLQIVAYPLLDLEHYRCDLHWYLRALEEVVIKALQGVGLEGEREEGMTGVWVQGKKVAVSRVPSEGPAIEVVP